MPVVYYPFYPLRDLSSLVSGTVMVVSATVVIVKL